MKKTLIIITVIIATFTACQKKTEPIDGSNATVTLTNSGANYVTENITVNPKDSIFFSFNIASAKDMKYVSIQKNPINQIAFLVRDTVPVASKNSYTTVKKFAADSANGDWIYRIVAHDLIGNYIGHKDVIVSVKPDFMYYTYRFLRVPDTTEKNNTCYMAATTGNVYSYNNGALNSASIDFGMYYDTTGKASTVATDDSLFVVYALNLPQPAISFYDISSWSKNATIMKKATSPTFASLTSAGGLRSAAVTNLSSGARNKATALTSGSLLFFKTIAGKAGCMNINFVSGSDPSKTTYINVDVKIEK